MVLKELEVVRQMSSEVRNVRNMKQLSPKQALPLNIKVNSHIDYTRYDQLIKKMANLSELSLNGESVKGAGSFICGTDECSLVLAESIDVEAERERITKEIDYLKGFLRSVDAKLSNERFVNNAKESVVENERQKKADAEAKIKILEHALTDLI